MGPSSHCWLLCPFRPYLAYEGVFGSDAVQLGRGRNAMAIYQDLVDGHGFSAKYASVKRFVVKLRGTSPVEARVVIVTAPGEHYGETRVMLSGSPGSF